MPSTIFNIPIEFVFPIINILLNIVLVVIIFIKRMNYCILYSGIYEFINLKITDKNISIFIKYFLVFIYIFYYFINFPVNLLRLKSKFKPMSYSSSVDILVVSFLIIDILIYINYDSILSLFLGFIISYCLWRIFEIIISKLQDILTIGFKDNKKLKTKAQSFNRMFVLTTINLIELSIVFPILFRYLKINDIINIDSYMINLQNFLTLTLPKNFLELCFIQKLSIILQIISFIVLVLVFFSNITNLNYKNYEKDKNKSKCGIRATHYSKARAHQLTTATRSAPCSQAARGAQASPHFALSRFLKRQKPRQP